MAETRTFDGAELNTEYLFGLFTDPSHVSLIGIPVAYEIIQFTGNDNIASATALATFNLTTFGIQLPVFVDTWMTWNEKGQITQYDAVFRWFSFILDTLLGAVATRINGTAAQAQAYTANLLATTVCDSHQTYCNGTNTQYSSTAECKDFLLNKIRFGTSYELGRNTLLCRSIHEQMLKYRPSVHCSHVGPTGGGKCVDDQTYFDKVLQNYFKNAPWIPSQLTGGL